MPAHQREDDPTDASPDPGTLTMAKSNAGRYWTQRASSSAGTKGRRGVKRWIGRAYCSRGSNREERTIERAIRQAGKRMVVEAQRDE